MWRDVDSGLPASTIPARAVEWAAGAAICCHAMDNAPRRNDGFRERGHQVTRVEAFVDAAFAFYRDALGLQASGEPEEVTTQRVRAHFIPAGEAALELLEATADDSPIAKYVARRGPGLHHITLRVPDVAAALERLKARGVRLIDDAPRPGAHGSRVAFIHPAAAHGVLVELKEDG